MKPGSGRKPTYERTGALASPDPDAEAEWTLGTLTAEAEWTLGTLTAEAEWTLGTLTAVAREPGHSIHASGGLPS